MEVSKGLLLNQSKENDWPDYPTVLDVVSWNKKPYQIAGVCQTKTYRGALYIVNGLESDEELFRIKGAKFNRIISQNPPEQNVYRKDEGVRITGELVGGKREK